jgi:hypothetical protein
VLGDILDWWEEGSKDVKDAFCTDPTLEWEDLLKVSAGADRVQEVVTDMKEKLCRPLSLS